MRERWTLPDGSHHIALPDAAFEALCARKTPWGQIGLLLAVLQTAKWFRSGTTRGPVSESALSRVLHRGRRTVRRTLLAAADSGVICFLTEGQGRRPTVDLSPLLALARRYAQHDLPLAAAGGMPHLAATNLPRPGLGSRGPEDPEKVQSTGLASAPRGVCATSMTPEAKTAFASRQREIVARWAADDQSARPSCTSGQAPPAVNADPDPRPQLPPDTALPGEERRQ